MWKIVRRRRKKQVSSITFHYKNHKETARKLILSRLELFNQHYNLEWKRVAIRNQRRCWGSCSSLKNLNFNYKVLFLPSHLQDYIIVHELCHLKEMNHGANFWSSVAEMVPNYQACIKELKEIDRQGHVALLKTYQNRDDTVQNEICTETAGNKYVCQ